MAYTDHDESECHTSDMLDEYLSPPGNEHAARASIELNEETRFILGRPNFWCASIAMRLRELGHEIVRKSEEEQAYVIHWMLGVYEQHGNEWRTHCSSYLKGA